MAQVLIRPQGPVSIAYLPRGPVVAPGAGLDARLLREIDAACAKHRAIILVVEPGHSLPASWTTAPGGFAPGPDPFQTSRTVKVQLETDAELLRRMRKDTRHNVVHAQRRGVVVEQATIEATSLGQFYALLQETSRRNGFGIHAPPYYNDFLDIFGDDAALLFSRVDGDITAGLIVARCGVEGRSMYAGSSTTRRGRGDAALLRFEAMRWARVRGCTRYDLGGIAGGAKAGAPQEIGIGRPDTLAGVDQFKTGFGGEIVSYPATVERRYRPTLAWLARRVSSRYRTSDDSTAGTRTMLPHLTFPLV